jgi:Eukaryotic glutathione synthase, ATP binding domain
MEKIHAKIQENYIIRPGVGMQKQNVITELGIFGGYIG